MCDPESFVTTDTQPHFRVEWSDLKEKLVSGDIEDAYHTVIQLARIAVITSPER